MKGDASGEDASDGKGVPLGASASAPKSRGFVQWLFDGSFFEQGRDCVL